MTLSRSGWPRLFASLRRTFSRPTLACLLALCLITLGELRLLDRLLFSTPTEYNFVLQNIAGVLAGTPVWKAFQGRLLGPTAVAALDAVTGDRLRSLKLFGQLTAAISNLLLFQLIRRRGGRNIDALLAVVCFGFVRLLLTFKLELPWDGLNILLFLAFGYWASIGGSLLRFSPVLLVAAFNHESALYIPLWYLLSPLEESPQSPTPRNQILAAVASILIVGGIIAFLRERLYLGRPDLPGQAFEPITPIVSNPIHFTHNVRQFVLEDWKAIGRIFVSASLVSTIGLLVFNVKRKVFTRASAWSLFIIAGIFLFGYINETRLYFPLLAFWFSHAWPVRSIGPRLAPGPV